MHLKTLIPVILMSLLSPRSSHGKSHWGYREGALTVWEHVHQKLNLYPLIIDRHLWDLIPDLFTEDAFANYTGFQPSAKGIATITAGLQAAVENFDTQHLFGTTRIDIAPDCKTADSTVYVQATLWTKPQQTPGQYATVYAFYQDHLVKTSEGWRIQNRVFELMGPGLSGNLTILGL